MALALQWISLNTCIGALSRLFEVMLTRPAALQPVLKTWAAVFQRFTFYFRFLWGPARLDLSPSYILSPKHGVKILESGLAKSTVSCCDVADTLSDGK